MCFPFYVSLLTWMRTCVMWDRECMRNSEDERWSAVVCVDLCDSLSQGFISLFYGNWKYVLMRAISSPNTFSIYLS